MITMLILEKKNIKNIKIPDNMNAKFVNLLLKYYDDYDDLEKYKTHIENLMDELLLSDNKIECSKFTIFNSVYHIQPIKNTNFKMPLHKLAPFLAEIGANVSWHNVFSEGCNVCFNAEEEKRRY